MKNMTLQNIAAACGGRLIIDGREAGLAGQKADPAGSKREFTGTGEASGEPVLDREAAGVVMDSRKVEKNFVFLAVKGERVDGHQFIKDVFARGALGVVCEKLPQPQPGPCILVEDSLKALQRIAEFYRKQLPVKVVGITGSVGKTSTKEFVASVLARRYRVHKTQGNYNNEIGVPLTVLSMPEDTQVAVLEMGINHFGEMHNLSRIARPDICVMTNIGQCHLEYLGSREGILKAKSEIFDYMAEDGSVCVNGDDDLLATLKEIRGKEPVTFGRGQQNRIHADHVKKKGLFGSGAEICTENGSFAVSIPLPGEHMVYNALAAAAVGGLLGLSEDEIAAGIASVQATGGRSHIMQLENMVLIDDCYNANPVSMEAALELLATAEGRKVAILGDMFELGEEEQRMHRQVGCAAVQRGIDCILAAGALSRSLAEGARQEAERLKRPAEVHYYEDRDSLMAELDSLLHSGDTVLVKASHGMGYDRIVQELSGENEIKR